MASMSTRRDFRDVDGTNTNNGTGRNKENIPQRTAPSPSASPSPLSSPAQHVRPVRNVRPSLVKSPDKQPDFFTDSYLANNSSNSSLIPTPRQPTTGTVSKPRRVVPSQKKGHRPTQSELPAPRNDHVRMIRVKPATRGTSPIRRSSVGTATGLSTPPRSREGSLIGSPIDVLSSPPLALNAIYDQIEAEEVLNATEGDFSDPESDKNIAQRPPSPELPRHPRLLRATTPTNTRAASRDDNPTIYSICSDPTGVNGANTGMSFVDQLSDQNLRAALTPHFQQSAQDREAFDRVWKDKKPIAFPKAAQVSIHPDNPTAVVFSEPRLKPDRIIAFSKIGKIKLASDQSSRPLHQRTYSDGTQHRDQLTIEHPPPGHNDIWHNDDLPREIMPHNPRLHRRPYFSKVHGFPARHAAADEDKSALNDSRRTLPKARSESPFVHPSNNTNSPSISTRQPSAPPDEEKDLTIDSGASTDLWAQQAADRPVRSIERDVKSSARRSLSNTNEMHVSPDKSRKLDFDFTGQSFQVSDSPVVRTKNTIAQDYQRSQEMRGLAKQQLTTNRLSQLRARESLEKLRQSSRSPVSETDNDSVHELRANEDVAPSTSGPINRTLSNSSVGRRSTTPVSRATPDKATSHDILRRLSRGSSSTPRSNTPSEKSISQPGTNAAKDGEPKAHNSLEETMFVAPPLDDVSKLQLKRRPTQATPKVTGAWTDTILPDTIKTTIRTSQKGHYPHTPHVSVGGWIDTPVSNGQSGKLEPVPESTQEVPEELMEGIAKDNADESTITPEDKGSQPAATTPIADGTAPSLTRDILKEAKAKTEGLGNSNEDTLNLGDTTIQSLEQMLDRDETDMTIRSQLADSDTQVIDRLSKKLGRLVTHLHDAKNQADYLQQRMQEGEEARSSLPFALFTFSIPIPMVLRPRKPGQRLPQLTPFGRVLLVIIGWYLLEQTLAELYSHPTYANRYTWPTRPEPSFPFVLPTMVSRWSQLELFYPWVIKPVQMSMKGSIRLLWIWLGLMNGFVNGSAASRPEMPIQNPGAPLGFDMMNDEYL